MKASNRMSPRNAGKDRWVRQFRLLKLGYFTRLNIMKERKINSTGSAYFHDPMLRSSSRSQSMNSVREAIRPAAAGIGKP